MTYQIGVVYVWHNQHGIYAYLNGTETTVLSGPNPPAREDLPVWYDTDTFFAGLPKTPGNRIVAFPGDLRKKEPPSGERSILELFKQPELESA